jgi:hypothetical protein
LVSLALGLGVLALAAAGQAEPAEEPLLPAPTLTLDALPLGIPLSTLSPASQGHVASVLGASIFAQRVAGLRFRSRADVFRFLVDHPDFAAGVARALRLGSYRVTRIEEGYWGDDARGATGLIRVLYADDERRLFHLEGRYERRGLPTITGQLLVLLEFRHEPDPAGPDGGTRAETSLTGHVRIDTPLVGAVVQTVGLLARPLVERAVEEKVRRFFRTVARVSAWAHDRPVELAAALDQHPEIPDGETLTAFRALLLDGQRPSWAEGPFHLLASDPPDPITD